MVRPSLEPDLGAQRDPAFSLSAGRLGLLGRSLRVHHVWLTSVQKPERALRHVRSFAGFQLHPTVKGDARGTSIAIFVPQSVTGTDAQSAGEETSEGSEWIPIYCSETVRWPFCWRHARRGHDVPASTIQHPGMLTSRAS